MIQTGRVLLFAILAISLAVPAWGGEIALGLEQIMESTADNQTISVLVYLNRQVNLNQMTDQLDNHKATLQERHETVVVALQETAAASQGRLLSTIEDMVDEGLIQDYENYWIVNAIRVNTTKEGINRLAQLPDVEKIYFNYETELIEPVEVIMDPPRPFTIETGLTAVRAPEVWAMGITGEGVLVANMDTGVDGHHPALENRWAGVADPRYQGHPEWAWYDPYAGQNDFPYDNHGHGTHTMGSVCGGAPGDTIGVAPGALWIASAPIDRGGGIPRTVSDAILSFQWMVDPDGNPQTNWDVPHSCSNSWRLTTGHGYPPCDTLFWSYLDACEAAGTVIIFSAGNEGQAGLGRPPDRATDDYRCFAVAAVDANTHGWPIASFSSRGPTYCTPDGSAAIKPDISAPGVNVRSSYPGGGYTSMSGTSMASPHINGVVALIRQANPNLSVEMVKQIIFDTAYDLGPTGEDNDYGWGMVDAYEAVQMALSYLEGYGTFVGQVTDAVTGAPLAASVTLINRNPEITARCNQNGEFRMFVPADSVWELQATYTEFYDTVTTQASVGEDDTTEVNFELTNNYGAVRGQITDVNTGEGLQGTVTVMNMSPSYSVECDREGFYFIDLPKDQLWTLSAYYDKHYFGDMQDVTVGSSDTAEVNFELDLVPVQISMIPTQPPIWVLPGGHFTYIGVLENVTDQPQTIDVWIMLNVPGFGAYGPVTRFNNVTLSPYQQLMRWNIRQNIPLFAPAGVYDYISYLGDYDEGWTWDQFQFTVLSGAAGKANSWSIEGWFKDGQSSGDALPREYALYNNYPNPFNAETVVPFDIPEAGDVSLEVYNLMGQKVATLVNGRMNAGHHTVNWDASQYSSGIYFYKLTAGEKVFTRRMTLLK